MLPRNETLESLFPGRKQKLEAIKRYWAFDTMYYRTNDWVHSLRVRWILEDILPLAKHHFKNLDVDRAVCLALVHDDAEIVTGDVQAGHKAVMSKAQLAKVHENERRAIAMFAKKYPVKIDGKYEYGKLLLEALEKKTLEAQLVSYADKMDAFGESLHELYAGNYSILRSVIYYTDLFARAEKKFPKLAPIIDDKRSDFTNRLGFLHEHLIKGMKYASFGEPFTKETIRLPGQIPLYNRWKAITLKRGGSEGLRLLIKQTEFTRQAPKNRR